MHRQKRILLLSLCWATIIIHLSSFESTAQPVVSCDPSTSDTYLDINNVRARIFNNGSLFYRGEPHVYRIPRFSSANAVFIGNLWIVGKVDGDLRAAASKYGPYEFWGGPLDDAGNPPSDCAIFDRIYSVKQSDIGRFESSGEASRDLRTWPTGLGAPTLDETGQLIEIDESFASRRNRVVNLNAGERPAIRGEQSVWWIMNDRGNSHGTTNTEPLGVEVHGHAFATKSSIDAYTNSTFYNYRIINKNASAIDSAYIGIWLDVDLGDPTDDMVGSDTLRAMGYVFNASNFDGGPEGYGSNPPALGLLILESPLSESDQIDNNRDGIVDEKGEQIGMYVFGTHGNGGAVNGDPRTASDYYNYLRGRWKDGRRFEYGGDGSSDANGIPTNYLYPGDPVTRTGWSEFNTGGISENPDGGDRRFFVSSGPFSLAPGEETSYTFALVWARGENHLDSILELRDAADEIRLSYTPDLNVPPSLGHSPQFPVTLVSPAHGVSDQPIDVMLSWNELTDAEAYQVELWSYVGGSVVNAQETSLSPENMISDRIYFWRVRGENLFGYGPWSHLHQFWTGEAIFPSIIKSFSVVQNNSGPLSPPDLGSLSFDHTGFPQLPCVDNSSRMCPFPRRGYQQATNNSRWGVHALDAEPHFGPISDEKSFLGTVTRGGENLLGIGREDYEIRFTEDGGMGYRLFEGEDYIRVPFELWNIGANTPLDTGDDFRMIPVICEAACGAGHRTGSFDIGGDHLVSKDSDDPFSDAIFFHNPIDKSPGEAGYQKFIASADELGEEVLAGIVLVQWNYLFFSGNLSTVLLPEDGTIFRIEAGPRISPVLASPRSGTSIVGTSASLIWSGYANDLFRLQVSEDPDFLTLSRDVYETQASVMLELQAPARYFWRIQGANGLWSSTWSFSLEGTPTGDEQISDDSIPDDNQLFSNYPNPFYSTTTIRYRLSEPKKVLLELFNVAGMRIRILDRGIKSSGMHVVSMGASSYSAGVYYYRITAGDFSQTRKMILIQ